MPQSLDQLPFDQSQKHVFFSSQDRAAKQSTVQIDNGLSAGLSFAGMNGTSIEMATS